MAGKSRSRCSFLKLTNILLLLALGAIVVYQVTLDGRQDDKQDSANGNARRKRSASRQNSGGLVYTQWGKQNCSSPDAQTVYSGVVGGSQHTHSGGSSNYICLPLDPIWGNYNPAEINHALIFGAEYEIQDHKNFPFHGRHEVLHEHNVPCAVCQVSTRSMVLMIPARNQCYNGWTMEYHGYLMTEHHSHKRSEYACVDHDPDRDPAGYRNENGVLMYVVEGVCGSLPCPPYDKGMEFTCAVCTK